MIPDAPRCPIANASCSGKGKYAIVALHNADPNDPRDPFCGAEWDQTSNLELFRSLYGVRTQPSPTTADLND